MQNTDSKTRFSNRVENYVKFRPGYPEEIFPVLSNRLGWQSSWRVADIGSGTGISSKLFLEHGNEVFAVEPNAAMRAAAEKSLSALPKFHSINASAEQTTLADASVDLVIACQAFHWFDRTACRKEFARILRPAGRCLLMWNKRRVNDSAFLQAYDALVTKFSADYASVRHDKITNDELREFFAPNPYESATFTNRQLFDLTGLIGRLLSSSYAPAPGQPNHEPLLTGAQEIFERYQTGGQVAFEYQTELYWGQLKLSQA